MSDTDFAQSEDINLKFQELKDKVIELKESNRAIENRLDALCDVGDGDQTLCPLCQRQDEEATTVKRLQARVKDLEAQERYRDEEIDKLRKSLDALVKKFDRLIEAAQGLPSGAINEANLTGIENAVCKFNSEIVCDQNVSQTDQNMSQTDQDLSQTDQDLSQIDQDLSQTDQDLSQTDQNVSHSGSETVVSTENDLFSSSTQEENLQKLSESGNQSCSQSTLSENKFSLAEGQSVLVCDQPQKHDDTDHMFGANTPSMINFGESLDLKERNILSTKLGSEEEFSDPKLTINKEDIDIAIDNINRHKEAIKLWEEVDIQTGLSSTVPKREDSEERSDLVDHSNIQKNVASSGGFMNVQSEENGGKSLSLGTPVAVSQSQNPLSTSVSQVNPNWDPGFIKGDDIQKTEVLQSVSMAEHVQAKDTSEKNSKVEVKFVGGAANFTKSSIKHQDFPKKQEISGVVHNQYHEHYHKKDDQKEAEINQGPSEGSVDLDMHLPVVRIPKSQWSVLAQMELDEELERNIRGIHTVLCIDTSASMRKGPAWQQTKQFISQFIEGLEAVKSEFDVDEEYVAMSIFGQEVRVVQRLNNSYFPLQQLFSALKLGGPSPMYGGLLMALAGVAGVYSPSAVCIRIRPRIILITDGYPTDPTISSGPDVFNPDAKEMIQSVVMEAVLNISFRDINIHCVPVGDADVSFLKSIAASARGKVYSYKDGRKLARKTINTVNAGRLIQHWKRMNGLGSEISLETSLENMMQPFDFGLGLSLPFLPAMKMASLSEEEKEEVLEIAKEALEHDLVEENEGALEKYHYESDNPNIQLPPLGTRVRRGPDWDNGLQDGDGPGTIIGHHRKKKKVHVEWDRTGESDFYCYGYTEKYAVVIVDEPRLLKSDELITTGCYVKRGKDWKYGCQDGTPGAVGVVIKVLEDGRVVVRWPDKSKNFYRFGSEGFFDLEICQALENQTDLLAQSTPQSAENPTLNQSSAKSSSKNENVIRKKSSTKNKNA